LPPPYLLLIRTYAQAHRADRARAWLARYTAVARDTFDRRLDRGPLAEGRGWVALAEGRPAAAAAEFGRALAAPLACRLCELAPMGMAFDLAGQPDSTRNIYSRVLASTDFNESPRVAPVWRARMLKRVAELDEARGARAAAVVNYGKFVELWKHADAPLQPQVRDVRARIARLQVSVARRP